MKTFGVSIYDEMRNMQRIIRDRIEENLSQAEEAYDATLKKAREEAGITHDPTCVPCTYCEAKAGEVCQTKSGNDTTPHTPRNYEYQEAVKKVHQSDVVRAAKRRYDELKRLQDSAEYEDGRFTSSVRVDKSSTIVCMSRQGPGGEEHWIGYKPLYARNVLGLQKATLFSHAEINYMMTIGVDVHLVGESLRNAVIRWLEPPDVREAKRDAEEKKKRDAEIDRVAAQIRKAQQNPASNRVHLTPSTSPMEVIPGIDPTVIRAIVRVVLDEEKGE